MPRKKKDQVQKTAFSVNMGPGRPPGYSDPTKFKQRVEEYFQSLQPVYYEAKVETTHKDGRVTVHYSKELLREALPPTVNGLALFLGFADRQAIYKYGKKENFSYIVKRALSLIQAYHEQGLSKSGTVAGHVFALKNMGWRDDQEDPLDEQYETSVPPTHWVSDGLQEQEPPKFDNYELLEEGESPED